MSDDPVYLIRKARKDDMSQLIHMRTKLQEHMIKNNRNLWGVSKDFVRNLPAFYEHQLDHPEVRLLVAYEEGTETLIGMALGKIKHHDEYRPPKSGRIDDVWVEPMIRRHGVCEMMFSELIEFFRGFGVTSLVLEYALHNKEAEITWARLGFRPSLIISTADIEDVSETVHEKIDSHQ